MDSDESERVLVHVPKVVFVRFTNATWQLDEVLEPGVYPVYPCSRTWFIDASRLHPVLEAQCFQIQLAPAFQATAHISQGKTLPAAMQS